MIASKDERRFPVGVVLSVLVFGICVGVLAGNNYAYAATQSPHQFLADVNGDSKADAVTFDANTGDWWVALSDGVEKFGPPHQYITGFGLGTASQFLADVNGDSKADAVTFDANTGDWWVAPSSGATFTAFSRWFSGHGVGSDNQFLADIDGDGRADAVVFFSTGLWYAAPSNGAKFGTSDPYYFPPLLSLGFGAWTDSQFIADVDNDGSKDLVTFDGATGDWWVRPNFSPAILISSIPSRWISGFGVGSAKQFLSDVNGIYGADAVTFDANTGDWWVAPASWIFDVPSRWIKGHGVGSQAQLIGDVNGDSRADSVAYFGGIQGIWYVAPTEGTLTYGIRFGNGDPYYFPLPWISFFGIGT